MNVDTSGLAATIDFEKAGGLVPAIVQHDQTGEVLMLGYMDADALAKTIRLGNVTFYSRSKQRLWTKGETSGNTLAAISLSSDCDSDAVLVRAIPAGPTCHLGTRTCFAENGRLPLQFLTELSDVITARKTSDDDESYTASLFRAGTRRMAQKVGEEGVEVAVAATADDRDELLNESADLVYHLMVLLAAKGMGLNDVAAKLRSRHS